MTTDSRSATAARPVRQRTLPANDADPYTRDPRETLPGLPVLDSQSVATEEPTGESVRQPTLPQNVVPLDRRIEDPDQATRESDPGTPRRDQRRHAQEPHCSEPSDGEPSRDEEATPNFVGRPVTPLLDAYNVLAQRERHVFNEIKSRIEKQVWLQGLSVMEPAAVAIYWFILGRTLRYMKYSERIPEAHFLNGVTNRETGEVYACGLSMSRNPLRRHLETLDRVGWIERVEISRSGRSTYAYLPIKLQDLDYHIVDIGGTLPTAAAGGSLYLHEITTYVGPTAEHRSRRFDRLRTGAPVRIKASFDIDGTTGLAVRQVDREGNDVSKNDAMHFVLVDCVRRMTADERQKSFKKRLCGGFLILDDEEDARRAAAAETAR